MTLLQLSLLLIDAPMFGGERNPMTMSYSAFFFSFFFQGDPKKRLVKEKNDGGSRGCGARPCVRDPAYTPGTTYNFRFTGGNFFTQLLF